VGRRLGQGTAKPKWSALVRQYARTAAETGSRRTPSTKREAGTPGVDARSGGSQPCVFGWQLAESRLHAPTRQKANEAHRTRKPERRRRQSTPKGYVRCAVPSFSTDQVSTTTASTGRESHPPSPRNLQIHVSADGRSRWVALTLSRLFHRFLSHRSRPYRGPGKSLRLPIPSRCSPR
jgi:hypothetical protein